MRVSELQILSKSLADEIIKLLTACVCTGDRGIFVLNLSCFTITRVNRTSFSRNFLREIDFAVTPGGRWATAPALFASKP